jgi:tetratricopeptide (TPR) repeat protein
MLDTLHAVAKERPADLRSLRPDLSAALSGVVNRMLEKRPEERFRSMNALLDGLKGEDLLTSTGKVRTLPAPAGRLRPWLKWSLAGAGVAAAVIVASLAWTAFGSKGGGSRVDLGRGKRVVAILPVEMLGVPPDQQWVGASFQDVMATSLLRRRDLLILDRMRISEVIGKLGSGTGSFEAITRDLGADLLVLGTLRSVEGQFKLSLRLVQGRTGEMLNQIGVSGSATDTLALEEELGRRLPPLLGDAPTTPHAAATKAKFARTRELYTKGVELMPSGNQASTEEALKLFEQALAGEPGYSPARAGLAWALLDMSSRSTHLGLPEAKAFTERAEVEARRAVAEDPNLASAHRVLGQTLVRRGEFAEARIAAERAVDLDPGDFRAIVVLADSFAYSDEPGSHLTAKGHYLRALELFPNDWWANYRLAVLLQNDGDLRTAVRHADRARSLQPSAEYAHLTASICLTWLGEYSEAGRRVEDGLRQTPGSGLLRATLAVLDYTVGDGQGFRTTVAGLKDRWPEEHAVSLLLRGMESDLAGNREGMRKTYLDYSLWSGRRSLRSLSTGERRTSSVNCYQMARILSLKGFHEDAKVLLLEAERLHSGKLLVAKQDPVLKQLK